MPHTEISGPGGVMLVSAEFMELPVPRGLQLVDLEGWLKRDNPVWSGVAPIGVFITPGDAARLGQSTMDSLLQSLDVPAHSCATDEPAKAMQEFIFAALNARNSALTLAAVRERATAAALRRDYMQLQENFLAVEHFLHNALSPKFTLARHWDFAGEMIALDAVKPLCQPLPVSSAALAAVDVWVAKAGRLTLAIKRPLGGDIAEPIDIKATGQGWVRARFKLPLAGPSEDMVLEITASNKTQLGLSHPVPLQQFALTGGDAPLALRLWKGLAGARLPAVELDARDAENPVFIMPADLPKAEIIGAGQVQFIESRNCLSIHPANSGEVRLAFRGVSFASAKGLSAYVQNSGPETVQVSMVLVQSGASTLSQYYPSTYLAPETYAQCDIHAETGEVRDLLVTMKAHTTLACLTLQGIGFARS